MNRKVPKSPPTAQAPFGDGRPFWARHPTLFPSQKAIELAQRALPVAMKLIEQDKTLPQAAPGDWLEEHLTQVADEFLRTQQWMGLPGPEHYRENLMQIQASAEDLLQRIRQVPYEAVWDLAFRMQHEMRIELRQAKRTVEGELLPPTGFEALLVQFVAVCKAASDTEGKRGRRPRKDLECAAAGLADLWTKLSGKRFPKTIGVIKENPAGPQFGSRGPQFVRELLPAFDESVTFAEIRTALKQMPVKPHVVQN
jgi:hypothetical protein